MATKKKKSKTKYRMVFFVPICLFRVVAIFISVGSYRFKRKRRGIKG